MRQGLRKVTKTVKGGARRSYWIKATPKALKSSDRGVALGHGMANLGSAVGSMYGSRAGANLVARHGFGYVGQIGGSILGAQVGARFGASAGKMAGHASANALRLSAKNERYAAHAAHLAGDGLRLYNVIQGIRALYHYGKSRTS